MLGIGLDNNIVRLAFLVPDQMLSKIETGTLEPPRLEHRIPTHYVIVRHRGFHLKILPYRFPKNALLLNRPIPQFVIIGKLHPLLGSKPIHIFLQIGVQSKSHSRTRAERADLSEYGAN